MSVQGHVPGPPQPHFPEGLAPFIGYLATREPRPLDERVPYEPAWASRKGDGGVDRAGDLDLGDDLGAVEDLGDVDLGEWEPMHRGVIRLLAVVLSVSLLLGAVGTVLELLLTSG